MNQFNHFNKFELVDFYYFHQTKNCAAVECSERYLAYQSTSYTYKQKIQASLKNVDSNINLILILN